MRLIVVASIVAALAAAQPHHGHHKHMHLRRAPVASPDDAGDMVTVYEFQGHQISKSEVEEGIRNGTLMLANNGAIEPAPKPNHPAAENKIVAPPASSSSSQSTDTPSPAIQAYSSSQAPSMPSAQSYTPPDTQSQGSSGGSYQGSEEGVDSDFPDGELDCSHFPSDYGAQKLDYLGLGGWTGIQMPGSTSGGYGNIETVKSGGCTEGAFCSYACPPGYQKSQWPETQGATGQSIGGVQCKNGKLQLTNKSMSSKLCMTGATQVPVTVQNKMGKNSAICRTDYPGTEGETVPLNAAPGSTQKLTCPAADNYYNWQGAHTSAQYYVNPAGVSVEDACQWGSSDKPTGNFAPLNLGVGYKDGSAWLSIFQNKPTTFEKLDYSVEIVGDNLSGKCRYKDGQYCSGESYDNCNSDQGCTVSASSGSATFVLS